MRKKKESKTKRELIHYEIKETRNKDYLDIYDSSNKLIKRFDYEPKAKVLRDFWKGKKANETTVSQYFIRHSKDYKATSEKEFSLFIDKETTEKKPYVKRVHGFKNKDRNIHTSQQRIKNFMSVYIHVVVRIRLNGKIIIGHGYSDHREFTKIQQHEKRFLIEQATMRALAKYGSNLSFKIMYWEYIFHQRYLQDFNKWKVKD